MEKIELITRPNRQKKYRQKQNIKGLVRFEIQLPIETKAHFDELVDAVADEYVQPYDKRRRTALARIQVFGEITKSITHEFFELKDKIISMRDEIKALSPNFFKIKTDSTPLPEAIKALPDDPKRLKQLLAKLYQSLQGAKLATQQHKRRATQYEALYNAANEYNDKLKTKLNLTNEEIY